MSLLLSQVGAPPVVTPNPAVRLRATDLPDAGYIEPRGLIRFGLVVAVVVAAVTPAIRITSRLDEPAIPAGRITTGVVVRPVVPARITSPIQVESPISGRITTAFVVAPPVAAPTPAIRVIGASLEPIASAPGRITFAVAPTVAPAIRVTPAVLLDPTFDAPGRVTLAGYVTPPTPPTTGGVTITDQQNPSLLGIWIIGERPAVTVSFQNANGVLEDPSSVKFLTRDPNRLETIYVYGASPEITRSSTGVFTLQLPQLTTAGDWWVRANAAGGAVASFEASLRVTPSNMTVPLP